MILSSYTRIKALIYAYVINKGAGVRTPRWIVCRRFVNITCDILKNTPLSKNDQYD